MTDRALLWNLLHDGDVVEISRADPDSALIRVEAGFLGDASGESPGILSIELSGCGELAFIDGENGEVVKTPLAIVDRAPDILSATEKDGAVHVMCSEGELVLDYSSATLRLEDGALTTVGDLEAISMRYWQEWERAAQDE